MYCGIIQEIEIGDFIFYFIVACTCRKGANSNH